MYASSILFKLCIPFALGSFYAIIPSSLSVILIVIRTNLEDTTLQKELEGYKEYANNVKYKILPGIW